MNKKFLVFLLIVFCFMLVSCRIGDFEYNFWDAEIIIGLFIFSSGVGETIIHKDSNGNDHIVGRIPDKPVIIKLGIILMLIGLIFGVGSELRDIVIDLIKLFIKALRE